MSTSANPLLDLLDVKHGLARRGDLIKSTTRNVLYRVEEVKRTRYQVMDQAGNQWMLPFASARPAPADAVFDGPDLKDPPKILPGQIVRRVDGKGGEYVVLRQTSPSRVKMRETDGLKREYTAPKALLEVVV